MDIRVTVRGISPLLMHNPRMVDPEFQLNREIKALTSKRKKTDEDLANIGRLEWYGGLYHDGDTIVQPTSKVRKSFVNTAKITKQGKSIERVLQFCSVTVPLLYDGPPTPDELFEREEFHSRLSVGVNGRRVMRVRPKFNTWALEIDGFFIEDAGMNFDELERIVQLAGTVEGIGDNRVNGYGRFEGEVKPI